MTQNITINPERKASLFHRVGCALLVVFMLAAFFMCIAIGSMHFAAEARQEQHHAMMEGNDENEPAHDCEVEEADICLSPKQRAYLKRSSDNPVAVIDPVPVLRPDASRDEAAAYELRLAEWSMRRFNRK